MHIVRRQAKQTHAVPATAMAARGPFSPELFATSQVVVDDNDPSDDLSIYANAQNNYQTPPLYRCTLCGDIIAEPDLESHDCEVDDEDYDG